MIKTLRNLVLGATLALSACSGNVEREPKFERVKWIPINQHYAIGHTELHDLDGDQLYDVSITSYSTLEKINAAHITIVKRGYMEQYCNSRLSLCDFDGNHTREEDSSYFVGY